VLVDALAAYVRENQLYDRVWVRSELVRQIHNKFAQTSYPNVNDPAFLKLQDKASMAVCGNDEAGEAIWTTMEGLIQSAAELAVYAAVLTAVAVDRWVLVLTLASAALLLCVWQTHEQLGLSAQTGGIGLFQRNELCEPKSRRRCACQRRADFRYASWLVQTYQAAFDRYQGFHASISGRIYWRRRLRFCETALFTVI
jgi:hypothetical protein